MCEIAFSHRSLNGGVRMEAGEEQFLWAIFHSLQLSFYLYLSLKIWIRPSLHFFNGALSYLISTLFSFFLSLQTQKSLVIRSSSSSISKKVLKLQIICHYCLRKNRKNIKMSIYNIFHLFSFMIFYINPPSKLLFFTIWFSLNFFYE